MKITQLLTVDKTLPESTLSLINHKTNQINIKRMTYFFFVMLIVEPIIILLFDTRGLFQQYSQEKWLYLSYFILHLTLWLISLGWTLMRKTIKNKGAELNFLIPVVITVLLMLLSLINGLDQIKGNEITVYIGYILMTGVAMLMSFPTNLIVLAPSYAIFVIGILIFQTDPYVKLSRLINGSIFFLAVVVILTYLYKYYFDNTLQTLELKQANDKLNYISTHDGLTGLYNRREFEQQLFTLNQEDNDNIALLLLDIDFFKHINDRYGHLVGDQVLIHIAQIIKHAVPPDFIVSRWGGEEFLIAGQVESLEQALSLAEIIRVHIASESSLLEQRNITVTTSLGVSLMTGDCIKNFDHYFKLTDDALYLAKENGRNRVEQSSFMAFDKTSAS
ncbi:MAG: GGDEF domain-containing protein [Acetobacterium sp.]|nr:GGDEF domain-containing protein [Acetobacterium sp.]